jgi:hypothetical protein
MLAESLDEFSKKFAAPALQLDGIPSLHSC